MKELLEKFVELCPKEWRCVILPGEDTIHFRAGCFTASISEDRCSGESIIFLLDYLEGEGKEGSLEPTYSMGGGRKTCIDGYRFCGRSKAFGHGKTRIEALVKACVVVWEAPSQPQGEEA